MTDKKPTGTCPTCGRPDLRLTQAGRVRIHRTDATAGGRYGLNCRGGAPTDGQR